MSIESVNIKFFDPSINLFDDQNKFHPPKILLYAPSGSGKSFVIRSFLYQTKDYFFNSILFSNSETQGREFFTRHIPKAQVYNDFDENILQQIILQQSKLLNYISVTQQNKQLPPICIIFDDFTSDKSFLKKPIIAKLFQQGRHSNISIVIATQHLKTIQPELRNNADYLMLLGNPTEDQKKVIHNEFASSFDIDFVKKAVVNILENKEDNNRSVVVFAKMGANQREQDTIMRYCAVPESKEYDEENNPKGFKLEDPWRFGSPLIHSLNDKFFEPQLQYKSINSFKQQNSKNKIFDFKHESLK